MSKIVIRTEVFIKHIFCHKGIYNRVDVKMKAINNICIKFRIMKFLYLNIFLTDASLLLLMMKYLTSGMVFQQLLFIQTIVISLYETPCNLKGFFYHQLLTLFSYQHENMKLSPFMLHSRHTITRTLLLPSTNFTLMNLTLSYLNTSIGS